MTRGICACPRTRLVSGPGDKDNSSIFIAASGTEDLNPCPGICSRMRENPILTACEPTLPTFVVTAICIFGHRSRRHDSKRGNPSAGRPRREGIRRVRLRRSSKRSQGSELTAVLRRTVERLFRRINPLRKAVDSLLIVMFNSTPFVVKGLNIDHQHEKLYGSADDEMHPIPAMWALHHRDDHHGFADLPACPGGSRSHQGSR